MRRDPTRLGLKVPTMVVRPRCTTSLVALAVVLLLGLRGLAEQRNDFSLVRVAKGRPGHVHPAVCVTASGTVLVTHCAESEGKVFLARSTNGGRTWSESVAGPDLGDCQPYPGALTTLSDGRIVLTWNCWLNLEDKTQGRRPQYSISSDDGRTWSAPRVIDISAPAYRSALRHALIELSPDRWIVPIEDQTVVLDVSSGKVTPLCEKKSCGWPLVRTAHGTLLSGTGERSTDQGKTWQRIRPFPACGNYANDLVALGDGRLVATEASKGSETIRLVVSRDDGQTWDFDHALVIYSPGRRYGNGAPHLAQLDKETLGVVFWDSARELPDSPAVFFQRVPLAMLEP